MAKTTKEPRLTRAQIAEGLDTIPLDTLLLGTRTESRLSPKQREFARSLALGSSKAQAYREAYNSKGTSKTQANQGYRISQSPDIQAIKTAYEVAIEAAKQRTPAQLREFVIHQLTQHALSEDTNPAQRIKALELLGKVSEVAAFTERKEVTTIKRSEDVRAALMEKLRNITGDAVEGVLVSKGDEADSLLAEIAQGNADNAEENGPEEMTDHSASDDPTVPVPPLADMGPPSESLHNDSHTNPPVKSDSSEIIGEYEIVSPSIEVAAPIVAEKVPAKTPTPSDTETPPSMEPEESRP